MHVTVVLSLFCVCSAVGMNVGRRKWAVVANGERLSKDAGVGCSAVPLPLHGWMRSVDVDAAHAPGPGRFQGRHDGLPHLRITVCHAALCTLCSRYHYARPFTHPLRALARPPAAMRPLALLRPRTPTAARVTAHRFPRHVTLSAQSTDGRYSVASSLDDRLTRLVPPAPPSVPNTADQHGHDAFHRGRPQQ